MLDLIAATAWFWTFSIGFLVSIISSLYILFFTSYWWLLVLYIVWIIHDRNTSEKGGRSIPFIREWSWWQRMKNYFNFKLVADEKFQLDPNKNYIFACYPHGILPVGTFAAFVNGYQTLFPAHRTFTTVLNIQFWMPVVRELFLGVGAISVSGPSIKHVLKTSGGNIVSILIGGADESKYSKPGKYKIILKKRKGFVKMALQMGSPLVPVFTFGETDVFDQLDFPGLNVIKEIIKKVTQVGIVLPLGTYLICPNKVPITTVVGAPIDVKKIEDPSVEDIEELHQKFTEALVKLFEKNKNKYVKNPDNTVLEVV